MKLTIHQVEATMTAAWGREAIVVPYRLAGNRYRYAVTDHKEHWLLLPTSWVGTHQVFELAGSTWPEPIRNPEPRPMTWGEAVQAASQLAYAYFADQGNQAVLRRLPRAVVIAEAQKWTKLGDTLDTWLVPSSSKAGVVYEVNGRCTCPDYLYNGVPGGWCRRRLARNPTMCYHWLARISRARSCCAYLALVKTAAWCPQRPRAPAVPGQARDSNQEI